MRQTVIVIAQQYLMDPLDEVRSLVMSLQFSVLLAFSADIWCLNLACSHLINRAKHFKVSISTQQKQALKSSFRIETKI